MVTDFVELFSVAVELPLLSHAIKLSLPCSAFESVVRTRPNLGITHNQIHNKLHSRGTNGALSPQLVCIEKYAKMGFLVDFGGRG